MRSCSGGVLCVTVLIVIHILIGYVRCLFTQQHFVAQKQALPELGGSSGRIYTAQGVIRTKRARLGQALAAIRSSGMLLVSKLGRIARSLLDVLAIADNFASCNVKCHSIPVSTAPLTQRINSSLALRSSDLVTTPFRERMAIALTKDKLRGRHQIAVVCAFLRNGFLPTCL